jgi:hypothetical protein
MLVAVGTTEAEASWNLHQHRVFNTISQPLPFCNQWLHERMFPVHRVSLTILHGEFAEGCE